MSTPTASAPGGDEPDTNRGPEILGVVIAVTLTALITIAARAYVRIHVAHSFGSDDYTASLAMLLSLMAMGIVIPEVVYGAGRHAAYLEPDANKLALFLNFLTQPIYLWAIPILKVSIGLFLLRITPDTCYRRFIQSVIVFILAYTLACFVTLLAQCRNISILWDSTVQTMCWSQQVLQGLSYANSTVNIVTDVVFAILPIPMLWGLQINAKTKVILICILGLGVFACAAAIIKACYIASYGKTGDFSWDSANLTIWTAVECNLGIIATCLPCLKPLVSSILSSSRGYSSTKTPNDYNLQPFSHHTELSGAGAIHLRSQTTTQVSARAFDRTSPRGDDSSEESLIQPAAITKTTEVIIRGSDKKIDSGVI